MHSRIVALQVRVVCLALAAIFLSGNWAASQNEFPPFHCQLIQAEEIEAIIGDGSGHRTRPGIWAMSSTLHHFSIFKNMSSGMLYGDLRGKSNTVLEYVDDSTCVLKREPTDSYPVRVRAQFQAVSPYYIDCELTINDVKDRIAGKPWDFRSVSVNCYANSPEDIRIHYLSGGEWERYIPPLHAAPGTAIAPSYVDQLEEWPDYDDPPFNWGEWYEKSFDEPFFYGRYQHMVLILVFDKPNMIRFYDSPTGGGKSLLPGNTSPAWDFEWIIPRKDYQVGKDYTFRTRMIYKRFVSDEDVLLEVRKAQRELGFETVKSAK